MAILASRGKYNALLVLFELVGLQNMDQIGLFYVLWDQNELLLKAFDGERECLIVFVNLSTARYYVFLFEIFTVEVFFCNMSIIIRSHGS